MFNHEAEAEVTLSNTGKVGFKYTIVDPEMEAEANGVIERLDVVEEPDSLQASELWPGRPTVIPDTVSWLYFNSVRTLKCLCSLLRPCVCVFFVCATGLHWSWCGANPTCALPAGRPWRVWEAAPTKGGFPATTSHHSDRRGNISKDQPWLANKP